MVSPSSSQIFGTLENMRNCKLTSLLHLFHLLVYCVILIRALWLVITVPVSDTPLTTLASSTGTPPRTPLGPVRTGAPRSSGTGSRLWLVWSSWLPHEISCPATLSISRRDLHLLLCFFLQNIILNSRHAFIFVRNIASFPSSVSYLLWKFKSRVQDHMNCKN